MVPGTRRAHRRASPVPAPAVRRLERPSPLSQQAYERIRSLLLSPGALAAADRLVERDLAARLSMSRTPVRDALKRLTLVGLLEAHPGGGYVPRRVTVRDVHEHFELRALLEPRAAALAASRGQEAAGGLAFEGPVEGAEDPEADWRFHLAVARASGQAVLAKVLEVLTDQLSGQFSLSRGWHHHRQDLVGGHRAVVAAIRRGDPDSAAAAMVEHLALKRKFLVTEARDLRGRP